MTAIPWSTTGNQGGSNPVSLGLKLAGILNGTQDLFALNPDDLQVMAQLAGDLAGRELPEVSDALAGAAIELIRANNIRTFEDLADLQNMDPEDIVIPEGVAETIITEIQALFGNINDADLIDQVARDAEGMI